MESDAFLSGLLGIINQPVFTKDENFIYTFCNQAFVDFSGFTKDRIIGSNVFQLYNQQNAEIYHQADVELFRTGGVQHYEATFEAEEGASQTVTFHKSVLTAPDGRKTGIIGIIETITELKKKEQELTESESKYKKIFENVQDIFFQVDLAGFIKEISPSVNKYSDYTREEIIGKPIELFYYNPEDRTFLLQEIQEKGEVMDFEIRLKGKNEKLTFASVNAHLSIGDKGQISGVEGTIRDLTERKQAEELLRRSETMYRNLIATMPDGVYRSTHDGQFVEVNPAMVKMLGYETQEELMAIDIKSQLYFAPEDRESLVLDTELVGLDVFPMKKKDGSTVWIEDHGWYIKDDNGKILFHEGILRDVTERKMIELQLQQYSKELQELNATKDKFFSIIAHDLKNPFNSIMGLSEILKHEAKHIDIETIEQYADLIYTTSNNTYRLLENLLSWALMQQGKIPFIRKSLIFKEMVNEVFELFEVNAQNKNISLFNMIDENLIIHADVNMIKTVIRNLVSNAIKYTSSEGIIEVSAILEGVYIQVTVKDNGTGIKEENINKLFWTGSNFTHRGTENESGTGLGLILCKEFIEKHQGTIWVESEIGKGSEFKFILPV